MREWIEKCMQIRGVRLCLIAAAFGILLLVLTSHQEETTETTQEQVETDFDVQFYTERMEERIAALCRAVHGVDKVSVLLTLEAGSERVYAENESAKARDYVILQGKETESAVLVREIYPRVRGVAVVCSRGDDSAVQRTITELLSAALGIPTSSIRVAGM